MAWSRGCTCFTYLLHKKREQVLTLKTVESFQKTVVLYALVSSFLLFASEVLTLRTLLTNKGDEFFRQLLLMPLTLTKVFSIPPSLLQQS